MLRAVIAASLALVACGRSRGVPDEQLGDLVIAPKQKADPVELDRAVKDPAELGRALALPAHDITAALGLHATTIEVQTTVTEGGNQISDLADHTGIELGDAGAFHALYTNSADYGREVTFTGGKLYLRPRYQHWHGRTPEAPEEPGKLVDQMSDAIGATWDLLAPGAELTDLGAAQVAGRAGRKIAIKLSPSPRTPPAEPLAQRKWREHRTIDALAGEVVLDADKGVPLAVHLTGTIGFTRDARHFAMKLALTSTTSGFGQAVAIAAPAPEEVVATPERAREVDDRDFLLQGIAPPLRKNPDGTAHVPDAPARPPSPPAPSSK